MHPDDQGYMHLGNMGVCHGAIFGPSCPNKNRCSGLTDYNAPILGPPVVPFYPFLGGGFPC